MDRGEKEGGCGWLDVEFEEDLVEWRRGGTSLLGFRVRLDLVGGGL